MHSRQNSDELAGGIEYDQIAYFVGDFKQSRSQSHLMWPFFPSAAVTVTAAVTTVVTAVDCVYFLSANVSPHLFIVGLSSL